MTWRNQFPKDRQPNTFIDASSCEGTKERGVVLSSSSIHRYSLWRVWDFEKPGVCFVLLHPSVASHEVDDPVVIHCEMRAKLLNFGSIEIVNLFALRTKNPVLLRTHPDPVGVDNNVWIAKAAVRAKMIICGWGTYGSIYDRGEGIRRLLQNRYPNKVHYLKLTDSGDPASPLNLPYELQPTPWGKNESKK